MIVAYTFGGGRDVFKAGIFFRSEVLKRIGCWFESCRPWLRHFRLRWDTTHGSTTTSSADALHLCRSQRSDQMPSCLQGESLPQFDIPYGKYVRHWDTETKCLDWVSGKTLKAFDSTLACFRLSIYVPPKTDTHGELKSFIIIHGMASTKFFEMDFKHSFAAEIAKVRNAFIGFCSAAVSDTCWIPSPKTTTDSQYPGHNNPRQFICRFP